MIRILHIAESPGGVLRYLEMLTSNMSEQFEHSFILTDKFNVSHLKKYAKKIYYVDMVHEICIERDFSAIRIIHEIIKKENPDIVYSHSSKAGALTRIATIGLRKKSIYNLHGWAFSMATSTIKRMLYKYTEKILAGFCDKIVVISENEYKIAIKNHICRENKILVIRNGISFNDTEYEEESFQLIPVNSYVIGMVGRLAQQKAPDVFVKMAAMVKHEVPEAYFIIVGDGEMRNKIDAMVRQYNLEDSFLITGWLDNPEQYISSFDQGVLLSRWEGFGLALVEYMRSKVPVIGTNIGAIPEVCGDCGVIIDVDNPYQAAEAVIGLYKNKTERLRLAQNGYLRAKKLFNIKRTAQETETLCKRILGEK